MSLRVLDDFLMRGDARLGLPRPGPTAQIRGKMGLQPDQAARAGVAVLRGADGGGGDGSDANASAAARDWLVHVEAGRMGGG